MGRKPLEIGQKTKQITFRVPSKYYDWIQEQLEECQNIGEYCRRMLIRYCKANGFKEEDKSK